MNIDEPCSVHYTTSITLTAGGICMASALLSLSRLPTSSNDLAAVAAGRKDFPPGKLNSPRYGFSGIFKTSFPRTAASLPLSPGIPLIEKSGACYTSNWIFCEEEERRKGDCLLCRFPADSEAPLFSSIDLGERTNGGDLLPLRAPPLLFQTDNSAASAVPLDPFDTGPAAAAAAAVCDH